MCLSNELAALNKKEQELRAAGESGELGSIPASANDGLGDSRQVIPVVVAQTFHVRKEKALAVHCKVLQILPLPSITPLTQTWMHLYLHYYI